MPKEDRGSWSAERKTKWWRENRAKVIPNTSDFRKEMVKQAGLRGLSDMLLARVLGIALETWKFILENPEELTEEQAGLLSKHFGGPASFWMKLAKGETGS